MEIYKEHSKDLYTRYEAFIDLEKTYDSVPHKAQSSLEDKKMSWMCVGALQKICIFQQ